MMVEVNLSQVKWIKSAVEKARKVLKKHGVSNKKTDLLETIKVSDEGLSEAAAMVEQCEVNLTPRQAEVLTEMALAALDSLNTSIIPEYTKRKNERGEDVSIYISRANDRVKMLQSLVKRLRRVK